MEHTATKLRPPKKTHGGKSYLARRIVSLMPEHRAYCEPFCGGASVLLNKPARSHEYAFDSDPSTIVVWRAVKVDPEGLMERMRATPFTKHSFEVACETCESWEQSNVSINLISLERTLDFATAAIVRSRMSRGGTGTSFSNCTKRERGGKAEGLNSWLTIIDEIPEIHRRVRSVTFDVIDYRESIAKFGQVDDALLYVDPPYWPDTRSVKKAYGKHELSKPGHLSLLSMLLECRCKVMLSGYPNPVYDSVLSGWRYVDFDMPNHSGQGRTKERRTERLYMNW